MADILYLGTGDELYPYRLLGLDTLDAASTDPATWAAAAAGHPLLLVAESVARSHPEILEELRQSLREVSVTIVPQPGSADGLHRRHLRQMTIRAMGVDVWASTSTATEDGNR